MNATKRILKNSAALSISVLIERGLSFLLPIYVARILGKSVWGDFSAVMVFILIGSSLSYWSFAQYMQREVARQRDQATIYLRHAVFIVALLSAISIGAIVLFIYLIGYPPEFTRLAYIGVVLVVLPNAESLLLESGIKALEEMSWIAMVRSPLAILRVLFSIGFLAYGAPLQTLFWILSIYHILLIAGYLLFLKRGNHLGYTPINVAFAQIFVRGALPFMAIVATSESFKQIDRVILLKIKDSETVGIYSTAIIFIQLVHLMIPAVMSALYPGLSRAFLGSAERFERIVAQLNKYLLLGMYPIMLVTITIAKPLILFIFKDEFIESVPVLQYGALSFLPLIMARLLFHVILAANKERFVIYVAIAKSVVNIGLNILLIPKYGAMGAITALIIVDLTGAIINLHIVSKYILKFPFKEAFFRPALCLLVSAVIFASLFNFQPFIALAAAMIMLLAILQLTHTLRLSEITDLFKS